MPRSELDPQSVSEAEDVRCGCGGPLANAIEDDAACCLSCGRRYGRDFINAAGSETLSRDPEDVAPRVTAPHRGDPHIGRRLGHFKILSRIGIGGVGAVYHALDESLQRPVALKVILDAPEDAPEAYLQRLFREARAQAGVNHPNVVHVYYVGIESNVPFLAMEWVAGGTLADRLRQGNVSFASTVLYATQITRALGHAANDGIVHGDIKPSNVLVVDEQTIKLSDFGLARRISDPSASGRLSGTPDYMPPEATRGGRADHRGDMYSLGVTLFQLTFGRLPYRADQASTLADRLRLHREAEIDFPERWPSELPEGWKRVLERLLDKDPSRRFDNFEELESELRRLAPARLTTANPLARTLAWGLDSFLIAAGLVVVFTLSMLLDQLVNPAAANDGNVVARLGALGQTASFLMGSFLLMGIAGLQMHWGNTTGKRFLQLLIVDQHGLKPRRRVLGIRSLFQFGWAGWVILSGPLTYLGLTTVTSILGWVVLMGLIVEFASIWLPGGSSLHDRLLGTHVALDAAQSN